MAASQGRRCPHTGRPLDKDPETTIRWTDKKANVDCELAPGEIVVYDVLAGNPDRWIKAAEGSYTPARTVR